MGLPKYDFDAEELLVAFEMHKDCDNCKWARLFFEPETGRTQALQTVLAATDSAGDIRLYLESSSSDSELRHRVVEILTVLNEERENENEAFVAGTADIEVQRKMWKLLLDVATMTKGSLGTAGSHGDATRGAEMSFQPQVASTPMVETSASPLSSIQPRKASKCLFDDDCPGCQNLDVCDDKIGAGSVLKSLADKLSTKPEGAGKDVSGSSDVLAASLSLSEDTLKNLASPVTVDDEPMEEVIANKEQIGEVRDAACQLDREIQQLSAVLACPRAADQWLVTLTKEQAGDVAAGAVTLERALKLLAALRGLKD